MPRALVLGATGHIGAHIVRALLADGHQVRAAYRQDRYLALLDGLSIQRIRLDLEHPADLRTAAAGCEWIFHAAGYYPPFQDRRDRAVARGVETIRRTLEVLRTVAAQRIVFTSSASTIQRIPGRLATEQDAEPWPLTQWRPVYAAVKTAMEHEVLRAAGDGVPIVVVNPSLCIGEYDAHPFSGRVVLMFARRRLPIYVHYTFNTIYTGDVGIGHVRAAQRGRVGERYLLAHRNITLKEFAILVAREAGVSPPWLQVPGAVASAAAMASEALGWLTRQEPLLPQEVVRTTRQGQRLDPTKAVHELGLPQTPIAEAVHRCVGWFRQQGYLSK